MHVRVRLHTTLPACVYMRVRADQLGALQQFHVVQNLERRTLARHAPVGEDVAAVGDILQRCLLYTSRRGFHGAAQSFGARAVSSQARQSAGQGLSLIHI